MDIPHNIQVMIHHIVLFDDCSTILAEDFIMEVIIDKIGIPTVTQEFDDHAFIIFHSFYKNPCLFEICELLHLVKSIPPHYIM